MDRSLLIIDDDEALLDGLSRLLHADGVCIRVARDPDAAVRILEREVPQVAVCDERMPGASGTAFLAELRSRWPGMVRILLTGNLTAGAAMRAINDGHVFRILLKPVSAPELRDTLDAAWRHHALLARSRSALALLRRQAVLLARLRQRDPGLLAELGAGAGDLEIRPDDLDALGSLAEDGDIRWPSALLPVLKG
ncbi:MAG: hypothetical protein RLZZ127_204 [Planctomycetota bacterium]|jgi:DNA-binding NtrC family response regulator